MHLFETIIALIIFVLIGQGACSLETNGIAEAKLNSAATSGTKFDFLHLLTTGKLIKRDCSPDRYLCGKTLAKTQA